VIAPSSQKQLVSALRRAQTVLLTAYILRPGSVLDALEDAARRGARVTVRLEGRPYGKAGSQIAAENRATVRALRRCGADASLADTNASNGPALHMKAAVCDGVAFLDDRNWPRQGDTIVRDNFPADVRAIETAALTGRALRAPDLCTNKRDALWSERRLLASAGKAKRVDVQSESFGASGGTYGELKWLAQSGVACRLIVARRDLKEKTRRALDALTRAGVSVRLSDSDEKMALVDGKRAWIGSANCSSPFYNGNALEWSLRTGAPAILTRLSRRFDATWRTAQPWIADLDERCKSDL
jgi:phosphatidylserine/phosphatidylglycerophosphate/cardiolipin synthase-like enzyme